MSAPSTNPSHLFLVRVWADPSDAPTGDPAPWQGKVQHVISGESHNFPDWSTLADLIQAMSRPLRLSPAEGGSILELAE